MLDRLSLSLVTLPESAYSAVLILSDADGSRTESQSLLQANRMLLAQIIRALIPGGCLRSQDGLFPLPGSLEMKEAVLAGLVVSRREGGSEGTGSGMTKPNHEASQAVPLRLGPKKINASNGVSNGIVAPQTKITDKVSLNRSPKRVNGATKSHPQMLTGVGFVDFSDDLDDTPVEQAADSGSDDELIDEDTLLSDVDLSRPSAPRMLLTT